MQQSYGCNMYLNELKLLLYPACTLHRYYIRVMLHVFNNVNLLSFIILAGEGKESYSSSWEKEGVSLCLLQLHWRGQQDWRMVLQRGEDSCNQWHSCSLRCIPSDQLCGSGQHCASCNWWWATGESWYNRYEALLTPHSYMSSAICMQAIGTASAKSSAHETIHNIIRWILSLQHTNLWRSSPYQRIDQYIMCLCQSISKVLKMPAS